MTLSWYVIRGSGIVAFVLLSASLSWGLMVSSKVFGRAVKAKGLQWLHESLGLAALGATVIHMVALAMDEFVDFTWVDVLVPGVSSWDPLAASLGVVAFWMLALVSLSFYVKRWIGQGAWRTIHHLSFGLFAAATLHGVIAGTDASNPAVVALFVGCTAIVLLLTAIRLIGMDAGRAGSGAAARAATRRAGPGRQEVASTSATTRAAAGE